MLILGHSQRPAAAVDVAGTWVAVIASSDSWSNLNGNNTCGGLRVVIALSTGGGLSGDTNFISHDLVLHLESLTPNASINRQT